MYFLIVDGGAKPIGCYGSYAILWGQSLIGAEEVAHQTFDLPNARTNNQAEYHALLEGLRALHTHTYGLRPRTIKVLSDSQLAVNQVLGKWKVKDRELGKLKQEVASLLACFRRITLSWVDRTIIEEYLGH